MKNKILGGVLTAASLVCFSLAAVSCSSGPAVHCADWESHKVTKTVTPEPNKVHKRVYDSRKRRYTYKWVNGSTPKPYATKTKTRYCEEWVTHSPNSN